jgi:hypothetical protein
MFKVTDAPSLDRKNTGHHRDESPVSRDHNLACARDQKRSTLESCGDVY